MDAHALGLSLIDRLGQAGIQGEIDKPIQCGVKLIIEHQYTCALYSGKKGHSLVFEGSWPDELKTHVAQHWPGKTVSPKPATPRHSQPIPAPRHHDTTVIYVDGSFRQAADEHGVVGWAFEAWRDQSPIMSQSGVLDDPLYVEFRNVAGECYAVLQALEWAASAGLRHVEIRYDYAGLKAWVTGEWQAKTRFTQGYRYAVHAFSRQLTISWKKVSAHSGERGNERVDRLAGEAIARVVRP